MNKTIKIGVMPEDQIRERMLAIASGKYRPSPSEPKIWFTSMKSVAEILSDKNIALLRLIAEQHPQ
jgi:predicted transcriptional regulator